jgi:hypothetical protein
MLSPGLTSVKVFAAALFFLLWVVVGRSDFNHQKIPTRSLAYGAWGVAAGYAALLAMTLMGIMDWVHVFPLWGYYQAALANLFLCGTAALALWWFGVWPAGDAKLFILLAALYPLTSFSGAVDYRRLFLAVLINTFIPACAMVFFRAGQYAFSTRLIHRRHFLVQLGWKKEIDFLVQSLREAADRMWSLRSDAAALLKKAASDPRAVLSKAASWLLNILVMSFFSYYLRSFFDSPILFTLFWGGIFLLWRRFSALFDVSLSRSIVLVLGIALLLFRPPAHWSELWRIVGNLTLFSLFFSLGISWTMSLLSGSSGAAYVVAFLVPFSGLVVGTAASWMGRGLHSFPLNNLLVLSGMGLFFGLSLVLVRLWDQEVLPSHLSQMSSYVVLAPGFIDRLRQDADFFEEHFSRLYADGLTAAQAEALREWCVREGVETIPLTPTISFASWIFFGFFLAFVLNGAHVLQLLF